jgi:hypothetical protein
MKIRTIVLVDYENIKPVIDIEQMPKRTCFYILGNKNSTINFEMLRQTQLYPERIIWVETEGVGRNNLDFHLAYFMGKFHEQYKRDVKLVILSKDKGYDNLIRFVVGEGRDCSRVTDVNLLKKKKYREEVVVKPAVRALISERNFDRNPDRKVEPSPASAPKVLRPDGANLLQVAVLKVKEVLDKGGKPRKLSRLKNSVKSILHPNPYKIDIDQVLSILEADSFLKVSGEYVQYIGVESEESTETIEIAAEVVEAETIAEQSPEVSADAPEPVVATPAIDASSDEAPDSTLPEEGNQNDKAVEEKAQAKPARKAAAAKTTRKRPAPAAPKSRDTTSRTRGRKKKEAVQETPVNVDYKSPDTYAREQEVAPDVYNEGQ